MTSPQDVFVPALAEGGVRPVRTVTRIPLTPIALSLGTDQRRVDQVLHQEPGLQLPGADDVGDDQVIGAVVAEFRDFRSRQSFWASACLSSNR